MEGWDRRVQGPDPGGLCHAKELGANVVKLQGERIKGWNKGYMCRWNLGHVKDFSSSSSSLSPPPFSVLEALSSPFIKE